MKKLVSYFAAAAMLLACVSCASKSAVAGHLDGLAGDSLKVEVFDILGSRTPIQTLVIPATGGDVTFDFADSTIRGLRISDPAAEGGKFASLTYVPGENAKISGTIDSLVVGGSKFYQDQKAYEDLCAEDRAKMKAIIDEYRAADGDEAEQEKIMDSYKEVSDHVAAITKDFVKSNPTSLYAATLLTSLIGEDGKDALEAIEAMPADVKEGVMKPLVDRAQTAAEKTKARAEAAELVKDGMQAPDFTLKNEKGEDFTLSSLYNQGKYIILDFWGEWCYWCKKGIPDMKQLYKDAKGKIEILSIDCGDTEEVWKKAIVDHELPWLQVYNPGKDGVDVSLTYAIQGYPTKVILNPDGTINKTIIGEDPEFYDYVKSLIGKK